MLLIVSVYLTMKTQLCIVTVYTEDTEEVKNHICIVVKHLETHAKMMMNVPQKKMLKS